MVEKSEENIPHGKPIYEVKNDNKMDLKETGYEGAAWILLAWDWVHIAGCGELGNEPSGSINGREFLN